MNASSQPRLNGVQALRGIAAFIVLIHHIVEEENLHMPARLMPHGAGIGWVGVDLFFVLSGFIIVYASTHATRGPNSSQAFMAGRLLRIFPAYWVATLAQVGFVLLLGHSFTAAGSAPLLQSLFLVPVTGMHPVLAVGWTLVHEMNFYIVIAILLVLPRAGLPIGLALWGLFIAGAALALPGTTNAWLAVALNPINLEFLFGAAIALSFRRFGPTRWPIAALSIGIVSLAAGIGVFYGAHLVEKSEALATWGRALCIGLPSAFILAGVAALDLTGRLKVPQFSVWAGDLSYAFYLVQKPATVGVALYAATLPATVGNVVLILGAVILSTTLALVLRAFVEKPSHRLARAVSKAIRGVPPKTAADHSSGA